MMRPGALAALLLAAALAPSEVSVAATSSPTKPLGEKGDVLPKGIKTEVRTVKVNGVPGFTTYRLVVDLRGCAKCQNVYSMAGVPGHSLHFPAVWNAEKTKPPVPLFTMAKNMGPTWP